MGKIDGKRGVWLIADFLPKPKVKASQFPVHISYFLQKCKKGKPSKKNLPYLNTISQPIETLPKLKIHSRYPKFSSGCDMVWLSHKFNELIFGSYCRYLQLSSVAFVTCFRYYPFLIIYNRKRLGSTVGQLTG